MQETEAEQEEDQPGSAGNAAELMKWFGRDWTADASLRVVSRAPSGTEKFEDVSIFRQASRLMAHSCCRSCLLRQKPAFHAWSVHLTCGVVWQVDGRAGPMPWLLGLLIT